MRKNKSFYYTDGNCTVCLLPDECGNIVARGLSICSSIDEFNGREGRYQSLARAHEAIGRKQNVGKIKLNIGRSFLFDLKNLSLAMDRFGEWKGYYLPTLTNTEKLLLTRGKMVKPTFNAQNLMDEINSKY